MTRGRLLRRPRLFWGRGWPLLEDEVQPRLAQEPVAAGLEQGRQIDLPWPALLDDDQRRVERGGRIPEERLEDDVLGAFDVELDGVEMREPVLGDEVEE